MFAAAFASAEGEHAAGTPRRGRVRAVLAVLVDLVSLVVALGGGLALATVWLLARSEAGAVDARGGDALLGWALWSAVAPAWTVWQWQALRGEGRTFGARIANPGTGTPHPNPLPQGGEGAGVGTAYLLLHPTALPLLSWVAACLVLTPVWVVETLGLLLAVAVILLTLLAVASGLRGVLRPEATPLYAGLARRLGALGRGRS